MRPQTQTITYRKKLAQDARNELDMYRRSANATESVANVRRLGRSLRDLAALLDKETNSDGYGPFRGDVKTLRQIAQDVASYDDPYA